VRILRKSAQDGKTTERKTFFPTENRSFIFGDRRGGVQNESRDKSKKEKPERERSSAVGRRSGAKQSDRIVATYVQRGLLARPTYFFQHLVEGT
jgi:hypothetical protein